MFIVVVSLAFLPLCPLLSSSRNSVSLVTLPFLGLFNDVPDWAKGGGVS